MIFIRKQEGLYQSNFNSSLVSACNSKLDYYMTRCSRMCGDFLLRWILICSRPMKTNKTSRLPLICNTDLRACLHGDVGPQIGEVTCVGSPHLSCKYDQITMRDYMNRRVTPPKRVTSPTWGPPPICKQALILKIVFYYINTNEIPGELSRENLVSSHVKITCYLHMWKYHRCYGYIINRAFHTKKLLKWNGLVVHWCLYNK